MRGLAASLVCALGLSGAARAAPVIGGAPAAATDFPAVAGLEIGSTLCTGELIDPAWVMTAAHCLDPVEVSAADQAAVTAETTVVFGVTDLGATAGATRVAAAETILDPQWDHLHFGKHDLALVHLATPYTATAPLVMNLKPSRAPVGIAVTMVGFGTTSGSPTAKAGVEYKLQNQVSEACGDFSVSSSATIDDADLLCFSQANMMGTCAGDSGGPLLAFVDGQTMIVGVTSFGDAACAVYGAYTRTDAEVAFLQVHLPTICDNGACKDDQVSGGCAAGGGGGLLSLGSLLVVWAVLAPRRLRGGARTRAARRACRARARRRAASPAAG